MFCMSVCVVLFLFMWISRVVCSVVKLVGFIFVGVLSCEVKVWCSSICF